MAANSEVMRGRDPVRLPVWVVIGVALALAGALAVVSASEGDTTTAPVPSSVGVTEPSVRSDVEMADLKAAVAQRFWAEQHGTSAISQQGSTGISTNIEMAQLKAALAQRFLAKQLRTEEPTAAHPETPYTADNAAPVMIDGELCGQCR